MGLWVNSLDKFMMWFNRTKFSDGKYQKFTARGQMPNAVTASWKDIWSEQGIESKIHC